MTLQTRAPTNFCSCRWGAERRTPICVSGIFLNFFSFQNISYLKAIPHYLIKVSVISGNSEHFLSEGGNIHTHMVKVHFKWSTYQCLRNRVLLLDFKLSSTQLTAQSLKQTKTDLSYALASVLSFISVDL